MNRKLVIEVHAEFYPALLAVMDELFALGKGPRAAVTSAQRVVAWCAVRTAVTRANQQQNPPGPTWNGPRHELN